MLYATRYIIYKVKYKLFHIFMYYFKLIDNIMEQILSDVFLWIYEYQIFCFGYYVLYAYQPKANID